MSTPRERIYAALRLGALYRYIKKRAQAGRRQRAQHVHALDIPKFVTEGWT